jgi:hypothetical protein
VRGGDGADDRVVLSGWLRLSAACANLARSDWMASDPDIAEFTRSVLLEATRNEDPRPDPVSDEDYEKYGSLSPSSKSYAAAGLFTLLRFTVLADGQVIAAIRRLAEDPRAGVRSEAARQLPALYRYNVETFWTVLQRIASSEESRRIVRYALNGVRHLGELHREEQVSLAHAVFKKFQEKEDAAGVRAECLGIVLAARARDSEPYGDSLIDLVLSEMTFFVDETIFLVQTAVSALTKGPVESTDPIADRYRSVSFSFLQRIIGQVQERIVSLEARFRDVPQMHWPPDLSAQVKGIGRIAHEVAIRTYFASGSFDKAGGATGSRSTLSDAARKRFLREGATLLSMLTELGFPDVVHNALETLAGYVDVDPRTVFLLAARAVRQGTSGGYQFDQLAASLVVGLVRRYLADYRSLFRESSECRDGLIDVNIFIRAGWPEALQIAHRLEEIYR